jgi:hypothetical protein
LTDEETKAFPSPGVAFASRIFTTEPKTRYHIPNATPTRKRAAYLMELLFQNGFIREAPYEAIRQLVTEKADFIGLDRRVIEGYIGRPRKTLGQHENPRTSVLLRYPKTGTVVPKEYTAVKTLPQKEGICQKLGYMSFDFRNGSPFVILDHERVPLPYHIQEMTLPRSEESETTDRSKDDLCVHPIVLPREDKETGIDTSRREKREERLQRAHTDCAQRSRMVLEKIKENDDE